MVQNKRVLIIEDDEDIQLIYKKMITDTFDHITIEQCYNVKEDLEAVEKQKPDMIFMDLLMPVMSGEVFLEHLRHEMKVKEVPVVVCSVNQTLANKLLRKNIQSSYS